MKFSIVQFVKDVNIESLIKIKIWRGKTNKMQQLDVYY